MSYWKYTSIGFKLYTTWPWYFYCRLAVETQPYGRQGSTDKRMVDVIQTTTDMPECLSMTELQQASSQDSHIQKLKHFIITGGPDSKEEVSEELVLKGRHIIIPSSLKQQVLNHLHINHMGIEKMKLLAHKCIYWHSINIDIEKYIKQCAICLEFQQTQPKEKNHSSWDTTQALGSSRSRCIPL